MALIHAETTIDRSPDEVWKVAGNFGGLAEWAPGIKECRVEGNRRHLSMGAMEIVEEERSRDEAARTYTYGLVGSPGIEKHDVRVAVAPEGSGSKVTIDCECEPDSLTALFEPTYESFVTALKAHFEGS
jgi:carbon monoxide dehydrogenase subunit G